MTIEHKRKITCAASGRLDKVLAQAFAVTTSEGGEALSRARLQQLIKEGHVSGEGCVCLDPSHMVQEGQMFEIIIPAPLPAEPQAQAMGLDIVYEDDDLLVINKPAGLVVHPAAGHWDQTLVNALLAHCGDSLSGIGGVARPGIVHRLDKDTSGLMVVAKNDFAHNALSAQFSDRSLSRIYQAIVWGLPNPLKGEIEGAIGRHPRSRQRMAVVAHGGKEALTFYETLETYGTLASLVSCKLATGRTHQIRVHMAHIGHPVVGDPLYGASRRATSAAKGKEGPSGLLARFERQALHAGEIMFLHPRTSKPMKYKAKLPDDMRDLKAKIHKMMVD